MYLTDLVRFAWRAIRPHILVCICAVFNMCYVLLLCDVKFKPLTNTHSEFIVLLTRDISNVWLWCCDSVVVEHEESSLVSSVTFHDHFRHLVSKSVDHSTA